MPTKTSFSPVVLMLMHHLPLWVLLLLLEVSQGFEEFGTDTELQSWWGFGFYLQVGGAAQVERGEAGSVHVCERKREENRKRITGAVWEGKPLLELHVCSIRDHYTQKLTEGKEETQLHNYISQGGRFSFDLDLSVHSLHAERFKGRVSIWLASAGWGEGLAERSSFCNTHSTHKAEVVQFVQISIFWGLLN